MKNIVCLLFICGALSAQTHDVLSARWYQAALLSPRTNTRSDQRPIHIGFYDAAANKTFVTWMGANSSAVVKELDHTTGKWSDDKIAAASTFVDKHNYPGMLRGADGRIHIFYGCHNSVIRHAVSPEPLSIDGVWQDSSIEEAQGASYPAPIITSDGIFYVFYRDTRKTNGYADDRPYQMVKSTDGGKTWKRQMIIDPFPRTTDNMCEVYNGKVSYQPATDGQPARIHLAWTIAGEKLGRHAHATYGRNVYYAWLNPANDRIYNIEGIDLGHTITNETLDKYCLVFDTGIPDVSHSAGLQVSAHYCDNGLPLIIFNSRLHNGLTSATWDVASRSWQFTRFASRSEPRETEKTGPESFRVFRPQGSQVQIYETIDAGANWTLVSTFSLPDNASIDRVHLIDNAHPEARLLLTQSGDGEIREARRNVYIAAVASKQPNEGWTKWSPTYKLQNWTIRADNERFWDHGDNNFTTMLENTDARPAGTPGGNRVEMRWPDWRDQEAEHMMEADVMYETGTHGTCIMQIKTNQSSGGGGNASIYLVVREGDLFHGVNRQVIIADGYDKWHNIKIAYNPADGLARVWINNELRFQHTYLSGIGAIWYFKNGAYWASASSKVHFRNLSFWVNPVKSPPEVFEANRAIVEARTKEAAARRATEQENK